MEHNPLLNLLSFFGLFGLCLIAWLGSENKGKVPWQVILWGVGLQLIIGMLVFLLPASRNFVIMLNDGMNAVIFAAEEGARFLFSPLFVPEPSAPVSSPQGAGQWIARAISPEFTPAAGDRLGPSNLSLGYIFAFRSLPLVIFFSAIVSLLYNLNIIQPIVRVFARLFQRTMNLSGAESLSGAANIFVGIESVLAVKPFLANMTRSELCAILASCFGSIASTVLGLYAGLLLPTFPTITGHLMSASVLTIPACFVMAKILVPEQGEPETLGTIPEDPVIDEEKQNPMDSLILGALDGVKLAVGIAAVIIAVLGLVELLNVLFAALAQLENRNNGLLSVIGMVFSIITLENIAGILFFPLTFLTGVSLEPSEIWEASRIIGRRVLETAVPPYRTLAALSAAGEISDRTMLIVSYVLCGFAHIPSVGIFAGGLSALVPSRRKDISNIVWKALWAATLATLMTGCIAGIFDVGNPTVLGR